MRYDKIVSIIIPTYKRPETLARAIKSAVNQSYKYIEVIVVDDNSSIFPERIATEEVMLQFADEPKVQYIKHSENKNGSVARNTGIRASKGDYIAFLDDDDEFLANKVLKQVECLESLSNEWGCCYTKYITKRGGIIYTTSKEDREGSLLLEALMRNLFIAGGSNLMVRRSVIEEIGGFDESFVRNQDLELLVKILSKYKMAYADELGLIINAHIGFKVDFENVTKQFLKSFETFISKLSEDNFIKLHRMINLQRFRYHLISQRDFKKSIEMIRSHEVRIFDAVDYICHLVGRRISKSTKGYLLR